MATKKSYNVDEAFIKAAHEEACSSWKDKIEKKFPEVFKPKETIYNFGRSYNVNSSGFGDGPLLIGVGIAPNGLEGKCLVVNSEYKMEVKNRLGSQILVFKKVK